MMQSQQYNFLEYGGAEFADLSEADYKKTKEEILKNILGDEFSKPDWIWVGPHSRRKINLQIGFRNEVGFFAKKSNNIVEIEDCYFAEKVISDLVLTLKKFLKTQEQNLYTQIAITSFDNICDLVFLAKRELNFSQTQKLVAFAKEQNLNISYRVKNDITPVLLLQKNQIFYPDFKINLTSNIFIQATKFGLESIIKIIRDFIILKGDVAKITDLYSGFGAYSFAIIDLAKKISAFEGSEEMVDLLNKNAAANNLAKILKAESRDLFSNPVSKNELNDFNLAIINPPRNGASPQVSEISKSKIKNLIYISCNPESFKRDAKILIDSGFKITKLTALDQFYSTKHLELISIFQK